MTLRSRLGSLQLPIAGSGLLVVALAVHQLLTLPPSPPESDGFVEGLAILFLYVVAWIGFVVAALGFVVPPGDGFGIRFNRWQRRLFVGAAVAAVGSVVAPLVAWSVVASTGLGFDAVAVLWLGLIGVSIAAFVGGLGWRAAEAVARRVRG